MPSRKSFSTYRRSWNGPVPPMPPPANNFLALSLTSGRARHARVRLPLVRAGGHGRQGRRLPGLGAYERAAVLGENAITHLRLEV